MFDLIWQFGSLIGLGALVLGLAGIWRAERTSLSLVALSFFAMAFLAQALISVIIKQLADGVSPNLAERHEWFNQAVSAASFWVIPVCFLVGGVAFALMGWRRQGARPS